MDTTDAEEALRQMERDIKGDKRLNKKHKQVVIDAITKAETALEVVADEYEWIEEGLWIEGLWLAAQEEDDD